MTQERDKCEFFDNVESLEECISRPNAQLRSDLKRLDGDIIVLGVSGKIGPTLAALAKRAAPEKRVIGVARFTDPCMQAKLAGWGIETITCDLLNPDAVEELPKCRNVIYLAGRKFGSEESGPLIWATNTFAASIAAKTFSRSRIVSLSTGCVYPFVDVAGCGARENTPLRPPPSDYTMSCVGREKVFEYFGNRFDTQGRIIRLNYAIDMRYGVLSDVASAVYCGKSVNVSTGYANVIWQGDANSRILRSLLHVTSPPTPLNVSGTQRISIRELAIQFGYIFEKDVLIAGTEEPSAWLVDTSSCRTLFGDPEIKLDQMIKWTANWVLRRMPSYGKPTKYDVRDGTF